MRVYIKQPDKRRYCIPVPLPTFLIKLLCSNKTKNFILKHADEKSKKIMEHIDLDAISYSIGDIKRYKGLKLVEVVSSKGEEVTIII